MPRDRITQQHQSYGFVEFMSEDDADYAIKIMNMIKIYGKPIRVNKVSYRVWEFSPKLEKFARPWHYPELTLGAIRVIDSDREHSLLVSGSLVPRPSL